LRAYAQDSEQRRPVGTGGWAFAGLTHRKENQTGKKGNDGRGEKKRTATRLLEQGKKKGTFANTPTLLTGKNQGGNGEGCPVGGKKRIQSLLTGGGGSEKGLG